MYMLMHYSQQGITSTVIFKIGAKSCVLSPFQLLLRSYIPLLKLMDVR
jgi:hypothetical protein